VFALDYPNFGVIVCDNASTDASVQRIEAWARGELYMEPALRARFTRGRRSRNDPLSCLTLDRVAAETDRIAGDDVDLLIIQTGANLGFAGGNNVGLHHIQARGDAEYVWLLNNDTIVAPDALTHLVRAAQSEPRTGVVGATVLEFDEPDSVQYFAGAAVAPLRGRVTMLGQGTPATAARKRALSLDYVSGACMLVPLRVIAEVGLLDERFFMYSEDADWCYRIKQAGYRLLFAPEAEIWHKGGASSSPGSPSQYYHSTVGHLLLMRKHHPRRLPITAPYLLGRYVASAVMRGQWQQAGAVVRAFVDVARGSTGAPAGGRRSDARSSATLAKPLVSADSP
jgi:GT2 family glycosyltransferase